MSRIKGIKIEEIIKLHRRGLSPIEISEVLKCSISNISRRLIKSKLKPHRKENKNWRRTNRYKIDINYFSSIDSSEKAYFLGLMYADGSVFKNGFYLKLKDEDVLLKMKNQMKAEQPVRKYYHGKYYGYIFLVYSQKLSEDLVKQGCFINKTYTLLFPNLDKSLQSHFIRGYFDGDGSLGIDTRFTRSRINFTSASPKFLEQLRAILSLLCGTKGSLLKESKSNAWHLRYGGKHAAIILNWLYKDATIFMKRKHDKFLIYKSVHIKQGELLETPNIELDENN